MGLKLAQWGRGAAGARLKQTVFALVVASVFIDTPAHAARWTVTPSIRVQETFTDNVGLDRSRDKESDLITEVEPGIFLRREGERLDFVADYRALGLLYIRDLDRNRIDHRLNARGTYEAVQDFFFVEAGSTITQQFESPFEALPLDATSDTDNRYSAKSYYVSPYIQGRVLGGESTYLLRNTHLWTDAGQSSVLSDAYTQQWTARFATPIRTFGLGLTYDRRDTEYDDSPQELTTEIGRAIGYWRLDPQFILQARAGREKVETLFSDRSENIYGGGFQWYPTPRTSLEAYGEHRVFGTGYSVHLQHRRPLSVWRLRATRDLSTYPENLFTLQEGSTVDLLMNMPQFVNAAPNDLIRREQLVRAYIQLAGLPDTMHAAVPFYSQQVQVVTRQEASVALDGARNTVIFTVYRMDSKNFSDDADAQTIELNELFGRHIEQRGVTVSWIHRLSGRTHTNLRLHRIQVKEERPFNRESVQHVLRASINTQISPKTNAYVGARYVIFDAEKGAFHDYRETAVFVGFTHRF